MKDYRHTFNLKFFKLILNVVGTTDYLNVYCVKIMTEPVAQAYLTTYKVVLNIIEAHNTLRKKYNKVLTRRTELLIKKRFRQLSVKNA